MTELKQPPAQKAATTPKSNVPQDLDTKIKTATIRPSRLALLKSKGWKFWAGSAIALLLVSGAVFAGLTGPGGMFQGDFYKLSKKTTVNTKVLTPSKTTSVCSDIKLEKISDDQDIYAIGEYHRIEFKLMNNSSTDLKFDITADKDEINEHIFNESNLYIRPNSKLSLPKNSSVLFFITAKSDETKESTIHLVANIFDGNDEVTCKDNAYSLSVPFKTGAPGLVAQPLITTSSFELIENNYCSNVKIERVDGQDNPYTAGQEYNFEFKVSNEKKQKINYSLVLSDIQLAGVNKLADLGDFSEYMAMLNKIAEFATIPLLNNQEISQYTPKNSETLFSFNSTFLNQGQNKLTFKLIPRDKSFATNCSDSVYTVYFDINVVENTNPSLDSSHSYDNTQIGQTVQTGTFTTPGNPSFENIRDNEEPVIPEDTPNSDQVDEPVVPEDTPNSDQVDEPVVPLRI